MKIENLKCYIIFVFPGTTIIEYSLSAADWDVSKNSFSFVKNSKNSSYHLPCPCISDHLIDIIVKISYLPGAPFLTFFIFSGMPILLLCQHLCSGMSWIYNKNLSYVK